MLLRWGCTCDLNLSTLHRSNLRTTHDCKFGESRKPIWSKHENNITHARWITTFGRDHKASPTGIRRSLLEWWLMDHGETSNNCAYAPPYPECWVDSYHLTTSYACASNRTRTSWISAVGGRRKDYNIEPNPTDCELEINQRLICKDIIPRWPVLEFEDSWQPSMNKVFLFIYLY